MVAFHTTLAMWGVYVIAIAFNRVFPKVGHSANVARIVMFEYTIGSVV